MIKSSIGKLEIRFDPLEMANKMQIDILDFSGAHAMTLGSLPFHHKDPFDRMIIAQAIVKKIPVMSDDSKFLKYECKLI